MAPVLRGGPSSVEPACIRQGREMRGIRGFSEIRTSLPSNMCDGDELMSAMNIGLGEGRTGSRTAK
jgi:hypothetical protein